MTKTTKKILDIRSDTSYQVVEKRTKQSKKPNKFALIEATELGFSIALPITAGALFGLWLDQKFLSQPKLTLSFLFIGIFVAFANLFSIIKKFSKKKDSK